MRLLLPPAPAARTRHHPPVFPARPLPPQELGLRNAWVSETIFWCMFIPFIFWSFSPFVTARKRFYTAVLYARLLMVLVSESRARLAAPRPPACTSAAACPGTLAAPLAKFCGMAPAVAFAVRSCAAGCVSLPMPLLHPTLLACPHTLPCPWAPRPPAACQILRIISFTVTQLPAPNYHCRLGKETAVREPPAHWWGHVVVDVGRQVCAPSVLPCCPAVAVCSQAFVSGTWLLFQSRCIWLRRPAPCAGQPCRRGAPLRAPPSRPAAQRRWHFWCPPRPRLRPPTAAATSSSPPTPPLC